MVSGRDLVCYDMWEYIEDHLDHLSPTSKSLDQFGFGFGLSPSIIGSTTIESAVVPIFGSTADYSAVVPILFLSAQLCDFGCCSLGVWSGFNISLPLCSYIDLHSFHSYWSEIRVESSQSEKEIVLLFTPSSSRLFGPKQLNIYDQIVEVNI